MVDRGLQAQFGQAAEVGHGFDKACITVQVAPGDAQHLAVAEQPEAGVQAMLGHGPGQQGVVRGHVAVQPSLFLQRRQPVRVAPHQVSDEQAAVQGQVFGSRGHGASIAVFRTPATPSRPVKTY